MGILAMVSALLLGACEEAPPNTAEMCRARGGNPTEVYDYSVDPNDGKELGWRVICSNYDKNGPVGTVGRILFWLGVVVAAGAHLFSKDSAFVAGVSMGVFGAVLMFVGAQIY